MMGILEEGWLKGWLPCARAYLGPKPERTGQCNGVPQEGKGSIETF